jgi:hypothetical protein
MAISVIPVPSADSPNNWTLLGTWTLGGVGTFTFSGLSGYKTYQIVAPSMVYTGTASNLRFRVNGDTASNYSSYALTHNGVYVELGATNFGMANPSSNAFSFGFTISQTNTSGNKSIVGSYADNAQQVFQFEGSYATTTPVSSITVFQGGGGTFTASNASANLVHIYGAN